MSKKLDEETIINATERHYERLIVYALKGKDYMFDEYGRVKKEFPFIYGDVEEQEHFFTIEKTILIKRPKTHKDLMKMVKPIVRQLDVEGTTAVAYQLCKVSTKSFRVFHKRHTIENATPAGPLTIISAGETVTYKSLEKFEKAHKKGRKLTDFGAKTDEWVEGWGGFSDFLEQKATLLKKKVKYKILKVGRVVYFLVDGNKVIHCDEQTKTK